MTIKVEEKTFQNNQKMWNSVNSLSAGVLYKFYFSEEVGFQYGIMTSGQLWMIGGYSEEILPASLEQSEESKEGFVSEDFALNLANVLTKGKKL